LTLSLAVLAFGASEADSCSLARQTSGRNVAPLFLDLVGIDARRRHRTSFTQPLGRPELGQAALIGLRSRRINLIGGRWT
jgi:hypothetical protein